MGEIDETKIKLITTYGGTYIARALQHDTEYGWETEYEREGKTKEEALSALYERISHNISENKRYAARMSSFIDMLRCLSDDVTTFTSGNLQVEVCIKPDGRARVYAKEYDELSHTYDNLYSMTRRNTRDAVNALIDDLREGAMGFRRNVNSDSDFLVSLDRQIKKGEL